MTELAPAIWFVIRFFVFLVSIERQHTPFRFEGEMVSCSYSPYSRLNLPFHDLIQALNGFIQIAPLHHEAWMAINR